MRPAYRVTFAGRYTLRVTTRVYLFCYLAKEDIRWREDMNVMFERQKQYLTSERSKPVIYCSCHDNIKFISSS